MRSTISFAFVIANEGSLQVAQRALYVRRHILEPRRARDLLVRWLRNRLLLVAEEVAAGLGGARGLRAEKARSCLQLLLRLLGLRLRLTEKRRGAWSGLSGRLSAEKRCRARSGLLGCRRLTEPSKQST